MEISKDFMKLFSVIIFVIFSVANLQGQTIGETVSGKITYKSSQNVYVRFNSTKGISVGDTLFVSNGNRLNPVLVVTNISSTSTMCTTISNEKLNQDIVIIAKPNIPGLTQKKTNTNENLIVEDDTIKTKVATLNSTEFKQQISGRVSVSSATSFSNLPINSSQRFQYSFSLNALHIKNSKFSAETYFLFSYMPNEINAIQKNIFYALKIYNLSVKYELDKNTQFSLGRKINSQISGIGSIDGLQAERKLNNFFVGAILGSRPNYTDNGYNFKLLQYGVYFGHNYRKTAIIMQNTFAFAEQMNNLKTDRRFVLFQHSNSLINNLRIYYTLEFDLYKNINEKPQNTFDLTSSYLSLRYRIMPSLNVSASYDTRKNIYYYETYKNTLNMSTLIATDARQGWSFRANYYPGRILSIGTGTSYRFQKQDSKPAQNINGFITLNHIKWLSFTPTFMATYLETSYLKGQIYNVRIDRDFLSGKLQAGIDYSFVYYKMNLYGSVIKQHIADVNLNWKLYQKLSLVVNFETTIDQQNNFYRSYLQLRYRF